LARHDPQAPIFPFFLPLRQSGAAICLARLAEVSLDMRNSLRNLVQTVWSDRRPTAMDCAMLLLMALLTCLTIITAIGQWTACVGICLPGFGRFSWTSPESDPLTARPTNARVRAG